MIRYEFNKQEDFKSIVPLVQLTWNLARNIKVSDEALFKRIKSTLLRSLLYVQKTMNFVKKLGKEIKWHGKDKNEPAHYCVNCEVFVTLKFNVKIDNQFEFNINFC